jgi:hypothetical protein
MRNERARVRVPCSCDKQMDIDTAFGGPHRAPPAASAPRVVQPYCIVSI